MCVCAACVCVCMYVLFERGVLEIKSRFLNILGKCCTTEPIPLGAFSYFFVLRQVAQASLERQALNLGS